MNKVVVSRNYNGLCSMQVCVEPDATDEEILNVCNTENPSGTKGGWSHVVREDKEHPHRNPTPCLQDEGRIHILVDC